MEKYVTLDEYRDMWKMMRTFLSDSGGTPPPECRVEGIKLPPGADVIVEDLKTWEVRADDVWIVTYPKAGTTWAQEIVSCLMHEGDLEAVNKRHTTFRVPFIELDLPESIKKTKNLPSMHRVAEEIPSPRVLKSHLPGQLLPPQLMEKKAKLVYVVRNPKDLVASAFYFVKMVAPTPENTAMSFADFFNNMLTGEGDYGPWWDHYLYFWKRRHDSNILFLRYEDMKRDLRGNVERIGRFLGKSLPAETLDAITEHCTFANMKTNPMANLGYVYYDQDGPSNFMRKGKVGDWKSHFTVAQNEAMDAHIRDKLHGTGLQFDYN